MSSISARVALPKSIFLEINMAIAHSSRAAVLFRRVDAAEYKLCMQMNRGCRVAVVRKFFAIVSRLGDGVFWYTLMVLFPLIDGERGMHPSLRMAVAGVAGLALYKYLKSRLVRERPYINFASVMAGTKALDRYSFPSGHTLHAMSFTILICSSYPQLGWLCIPFAVLVAASRVLLGLHYPSDVLAGASIGATVAMLTMWLLPG
jgi:undecaprenyl-diphosphatase